MRPQATIGADCGSTNGGFGAGRPDGRGDFDVWGWEWKGPTEMAAALARLRVEIRALRAAGYDVTVYAERAFSPRKPGKFRGAGLVQSEAVGRIQQVCDEEGVPLLRVASQTWRSRWGMNPHAPKAALERASRSWGRLLLGAPGHGDHLSDGLLVGLHDTPEAILWASRQRSAAAGTKAALLLETALLAVTSGAVSAATRPLRTPGRAPGGANNPATRRSAVTWTEEELAAYRTRIGR